MAEVRFKHAENVVVRDEGEETFLFNADTAAFIVVNETARFIWDKIAEETSVGDIVTSLLKEYDVSEETARQDTHEHLEQLVQRGFLVHV